jgi:hypothetical protein
MVQYFRETAGDLVTAISSSSQTSAEPTATTQPVQQIQLLIRISYRYFKRVVRCAMVPWEVGMAQVTRR